MRPRPSPIEDLRRTVECLPRHTREAMLEGIRAHPIVVGAYTDRDGGVCPMLAAHRHGGRTDFLAFSRAWDRFARVTGRPRRATEREVRVLASHLEASLLADEGVDLGRALAEHRDLQERNVARRGRWLRFRWAGRETARREPATPVAR